jgi:hypothetical protein
MIKNQKPPPLLLILGDLLAVLLITLLGFDHHGESTAWLRMFTTILPLCLGWGLAAGLLGLYQEPVARDAHQIWRPAVAALLGAPLACWLRGAWLGAPIPPIFILVMVSAVAIVMTVWRGGWMLVKRRQVGYG